MTQYIREICITLVIFFVVIMCTANVSRAEEKDSKLEFDYYQTTDKLVQQPQNNVEASKMGAISSAMGFDENAIAQQAEVLQAIPKAREVVTDKYKNKLVTRLKESIRTSIFNMIEESLKALNIELEDEEINNLVDYILYKYNDKYASAINEIGNRAEAEFIETLVNNFRDVIDYAEKQGNIGVEKGVEKLFDIVLNPLESEVQRWVSKIDVPIIGDTIKNFASSFIDRTTEGWKDKFADFIKDNIGLEIEKKSDEIIQNSKNESTKDGIPSTTTNNQLTKADRQTWRWESELAYSALAATNTYVSNIVDQAMGNLTQNFVDVATEKGVHVDLAKDFTSTLSNFVQGNFSMWLEDRSKYWMKDIEEATHGGNVSAETLQKVYDLNLEDARKMANNELSEERIEQIQKDMRKEMHNKYSQFGKETLNQMAGQIGTMTKQLAYSLFDRTFGSLEDLKEKYGNIGGSAIKAVTNQIKYKLGPQLEDWVSDTLSAYWTKGGEELTNALNNRSGISLKFETKDLWTFGADLIGGMIGDENTAMYAGMFAGLAYDAVQGKPLDLGGISINAKPFSYDKLMGAAVSTLNGSGGGWKDVVKDAGTGAVAAGAGYDDSPDMFLVKGNAHITAVFGPNAHKGKRITGVSSTVWNPLMDALVYSVTGLGGLPRCVCGHGSWGFNGIL